MLLFSLSRPGFLRRHRVGLSGLKWWLKSQNCKALHLQQCLHKPISKVEIRPCAAHHENISVNYVMPVRKVKKNENFPSFYGLWLCSDKKNRSRLGLHEKARKIVVNFWRYKKLSSFLFKKIDANKKIKNCSDFFFKKKKL